MVKKTEETKQAEMPKVENVEKVEIGTAELAIPKMTPELVANVLNGNFSYIKKNFSVSQFNKKKSKEDKIKLLEDYKKLIDSMHYLFKGWG